MKQRIVLIVLFLVILLLLIFGLAPRKTVEPVVEAPEETQSTPREKVAGEETMILLTINGFEPSTLQITAGQSVTWVNVSGKTGNVSSDDHPEHTKYPFLTVGNIKVDESAYVRFEKPGTYTYHNHLKPTQTGTIVVQ